MKTKLKYSFKDLGILIIDTGTGNNKVKCPKCKNVTLNVNLDMNQFNCEKCSFNGNLETGIENEC